ncbi:Uncharacterised protein [Acholeplasma oculi]|uniref:Putative truncated MurD-like peptide ligase n=1 Tax=Acholeplasma oculi TaxID=35623 RepID=A0A061A8Z3_9MOLU|nr:Mur ligase family protein [Acholeplasma oculi]CDR30355.1 putative truncated MurD-like peptide ligase [Acholeplasma oculi]SKC42341.1 Mur ligase middle domain-containing protein [Acholeplasma oculi]SUT88859.1 Uncharacterised protein [Acholeplasma oculi]
MKVIVITGSYGKKSVTKILFDYFKKIRHRTKLYKLEEIIEVDNPKNIQDIIDKDKLEGIQVVILETSFKHLNLLEMIECEVLLITNYYKNKAVDNVTIGQLNILLKKFINNCSQIIVNSNCMNQTHLVAENIKTFGIDNTSDYKLKISSDTIDGLKIEYGNQILRTSLITSLHAENILCAIAVLESMELLNVRKIQIVIRNIQVDGHIQSINFRNRRTMIVDKRSNNFRDLIDAIVRTTKSYNYKLMIMMNEPMHHSLKTWSESQDMLELKKSKYTYIMNDSKRLEENGQLLSRTLVQQGVYLFECFDNSSHYNKKIYKSIKKNEILIILTQEKISKILRDMEN